MVKSAYASSSGSGAAVLAPGTRIEVGFKGIWSPGRVTAYVGEADPVGADGRRRRGSKGSSKGSK